MDNYDKVTSSDLAGIYKDIAEVIGIEATTLLHDNFQGQQITLPKKLYTRTFIMKQIKDNSSDGNIVKRTAREFGYTERRIRQIMKESETEII